MSERISKRAVVAAVFICGLVAALVAVHRFGGDSAPVKANVILISVDTLRADHLGCYGWDLPTSPFVDRFNEDAVHFEKCLAQAPSTEPSHASIFTSRIPSHHGAFFSRRLPLPDEMVTMAEILKENGYRTASFSDAGQMADIWGLDQGFDEYLTVHDGALTARFSATVERANDWLESHSEERFFLFLHTYEPHHPYMAPRSYLDALGHEYGGDLPDQIDKELLNEINYGTRKIDDADRRHVSAAYDAEIRAVDEAFGQLVAQLERLDLYDDTLIVFTSDHGEELGEHGWMGWHSHTLYDELLRVPLIIKLPGNRHGGSEVSGLTRGIDVLPTVLDVLDIPLRKEFEGRSLLEFVESGASSIDESVAERDAVEPLLPTALHRGDWKYYRKKKSKTKELYDLQKDPGELEDLAASRPEVMKSMEGRLEEIVTSRTDWAKKPAQARSDEVEIHKDTARKLKALGYVVEAPRLSLAEALGDLGCPECSVLLVTLDTTRADHLPCYGSGKDTAPRICAYAEKGVLFENAYSSAPSGIPSLMNTMSGHVVSNGQLGDVLGDYARRPTLAERMSKSGLRTALISDYVLMGTLDKPWPGTAGLLRGFETVTNVGSERPEAHAPLLVDAAVAWLGEHRDERFFLWTHFYDPHFRYRPTPEHARRFGFDPATCGRVSHGMSGGEIRRQGRDLTPREVECLTALHQAEIYATDQQIGRLLDTLEELDLDDETLVVITSDHGEEFLERNRIGHEQTVYDELIHVPLVIRHPGLKRPGRVAKDVSTVQLHDIVRGAVEGRPVEMRDEIVARTYRFDRGGGSADPATGQLSNEFALISGRYKVIYNPMLRRWERYDLAHDPSERRLAIEDEDSKDLARRLLSWMAESRFTPGGAPRSGGN